MKDGIDSLNDKKAEGPQQVRRAKAGKDGGDAVESLSQAGIRTRSGQAELQGLPFCYQCFDTAGIIIDVNQQWLEEFGYVREDVIGKNFEVFLPKTHQNRFHEFLGRDWTAGKSAGLNAQLRTGRGKLVNISLSIKPGSAAATGITILHCILHDPSGQVKTQEQLRKSVSKYTQLFDSMEHGIIFYNKNCRITSVNPAAERILGLSRKQLAKMLPEEFRQRLIGEDGKVLPLDELPCLVAFYTGKEVLNRIVGIPDPGSEEVRWVSINTKPLYRPGSKSPYQVYTSLVNITPLKQIEQQRRQLEEQFFQAQKMESIGRLAGGIAHDFNNILTAVSGWAEILKMNHPDSNDDVGQAADVILNSTNRAAQLTRQLLNFSRKGTFHSVPLNLNEAIREALEVTEKIFSKKIQVICELADDIDTVESDRTQMMQVLTNLIINARDAMPEGGHLTIATTVVDLSEEEVKARPLFQPGRYVKMSVSDSGTGMTREVQSRIFEPFFTTKEKGIGTGLGLATVYGIVRNHGGYINVYSEPGVGTEFRIYLPVSGRLEAGRKQDPQLQKGSGRILVIEDEEPVRALLVTQLSGLGYEVLAAANGREGVEMYEKSGDRTDLIILDLIMPEMDGLETFDRIRKINSEAKVLLVSGFNQPGKAYGSLASKVSGFVGKPYNLEILSSAIAKALKQKP